MKARIVYFFALLFCTAFNLAGQNRLQFKEETIHFEPIMDGEKIEITFDFKVLGSDKLFIHQVYPGCSCTTPTYSSDTLKPNENGKVTVQFDSEGWGTDTGYHITKHIYVLYNGGSQVVYFDGIVFSKDTVSKIKFDELVHDFGNIPQGTPVMHYFIFTNYNRKPVIINSVQSSSDSLGPLWSRDTIAYNKTGKVGGMYNAATKGHFSKTLNVNTNLGTVILTLKGIVEMKKEEEMAIPH